MLWSTCYGSPCQPQPWPGAALLHIWVNLTLMVDGFLYYASSGVVCSCVEQLSASLRPPSVQISHRLRGPPRLSPAAFPHQGVLLFGVPPIIAWYFQGNTLASTPELMITFSSLEELRWQEVWN